MNILKVTNEFHAAVITAETTWEMLKLDRQNRTIKAKYLRALRQCDRVRRHLKMMMETGNL
jgi:fructose-1,6-bisphosphatase